MAAPNRLEIGMDINGPTFRVKTPEMCRDTWNEVMRENARSGDKSWSKP